MFYGEFKHNLDDKGRVIMPTKYREQLKGTFYICKDLWSKPGEECLFVYSQEGFDELANKLRQMHNSQDEIRKHNRRFFSSVQDTETDKQGRVVISAELREYAGLDKEVVLAGLDDHIEIWNREKWEAYNDADEDLYATGKLAESFGSNGI